MAGWTHPWRPCTACPPGDLERASTAATQEGCSPPSQLMHRARVGHRPAIARAHRRNRACDRGAVGENAVLHQDAEEHEHGPGRTRRARERCGIASRREAATLSTGRLKTEPGFRLPTHAQRSVAMARARPAAIWALSSSYYTRAQAGCARRRPRLRDWRDALASVSTTLRSDSGVNILWTSASRHLVANVRNGVRGARGSYPMPCCEKGAQGFYIDAWLHRRRCLPRNRSEGPNHSTRPARHPQIRRPGKSPVPQMIVQIYSSTPHFDARFPWTLSELTQRVSQMSLLGGVMRTRKRGTKQNLCLLPRHAPASPHLRPTPDHTRYPMVRATSAFGWVRPSNVLDTHSQKRGALLPRLLMLEGLCDYA